MNRRELAGIIADKIDLPAAAVAGVLEAVVGVVQEQLNKAGRFDWRGLGAFTVRTYPPRKIHNPSTGQTIELPGRTSIAFKPSAQLRSRLKPADRHSTKRRRRS